MKIAEVMEKMIVFSKENMHDIDHFMKVWRGMITFILP